MKFAPLRMRRRTTSPGFMVKVGGADGVHVLAFALLTATRCPFTVTSANAGPSV